MIGYVFLIQPGKMTALTLKIVDLSVKMFRPLKTLAELFPSFSTFFHL